MTAATVEADGRRIEVRARVVVNAAGVWADEIRALEDPTAGETIRPAKGIHITVPWDKVRNDIAVVIPVPKDKRSLFVVPWGRRADGTFEHTYVGTTDTDYQGPLEDPACTAEDIAYVLRALNHTVTTEVTTEDVSGVWAGLRPLVKSATSGRTADLSRRHQVSTGPGGVIAITGGKLTTYREMADDTVDTVMRQLGRRGRCRTKKLRLFGAEGYVEPPDESSEHHLAVRYGSAAPRHPGVGRRRSVARRAAGAGAGLRARRGRVRGAPRDGHDVGGRADPTHASPPVRPAGRRRGRAGRRRAAGRRAGLGRRRDVAPARRLPPARRGRRPRSPRRWGERSRRLPHTG